MPIVSMTELLTDARKRAYAVSYCEAWSLESFQAIVEAGEEEKSPIMTGFNGGFLMHPGRKRPEDLRFYASLGKGLERARVPCVMMFNESFSLDQIQKAIDLGFNAVMVENEGIELDEYRRMVRETIAKSHSRGVSVEAQVGHLSDASANGSSGHAEPTTPASAKAFVQETGIDALGVAVGNVHILTTGTAPLDFQNLAAIGKAVSVPLVLHGGTGIPLSAAKRAVEAGVSKVNFGTGLKQAYLAAVRDKLNRYHEPMSPHPFIGMGGNDDILTAGAEAVKTKCRELLRAWGSSGKA